MSYKRSGGWWVKCTVKPFRATYIKMTARVLDYLSLWSRSQGGPLIRQAKPHSHVLKGNGSK